MLAGTVLEIETRSRLSNDWSLSDETDTRVCSQTGVFCSFDDDVDVFAVFAENPENLQLVIVPEQVPVLFRAGTTSLRSGLGTFFVPDLDHAKHFC